MERNLCVLYFLICLLWTGINKADAEPALEEEQPRIYRWRQFDYTGNEEIDMTSLESVFHPVILTSELHGEHVTLMMSYTERIASTPFWQMKFDGVSYTITQGTVVRNGKQISSTVDLPVSWNTNQFLAFSVSSDIGTYYIELDYDVISTNTVDMSVPRMGMKMEVPDTFANDEFQVKLERDSVYNESCFTFLACKALLRTVDKVKDKVERLPRLGVYVKEKRYQQQTTEFGIMDDYLDHDAEVVVFSYCSMDNMEPPRIFWTLDVFKDMKLIDYTRKSSEKQVDMNFVDGIYGNQDTVSVDEAFPQRSVSCEVFGYPKPEVSIQDKDGKPLPVVELKQNSDMTSHVISSLEGLPFKDVLGKYTCIATSGNKSINKTIEVKRVMKPEILLTEVVVNNTDKIIAFCTARGQPAPKVSFSVNDARLDKVEKRPLLEIESTVSHTTVSRYTRKGGLNVDRWFETNAERCPKPEYFTQESVKENHDVTKTMMTMKPLPYLSRYQVMKLYCTAEGEDNVYTTSEVTTKVFGSLKIFMKAAHEISALHLFG